MSGVNENEVEAAGLDLKEVKRIANGLSRYALQAQRLGIKIFGGAGSGTLRFDDGVDDGHLILADLKGDFDGGDGAANDDENGLLRGEF